MPIQVEFDSSDFDDFIHSIDVEISKHIEEYAAAFIMYTKLPPDRVVMIFHPDISTGRYRLWFEERKKENEDQANVNH